MIKFKCKNCGTENTDLGFIYYKGGKRVFHRRLTEYDLVLCHPCDSAVNCALKFYRDEYGPIESEEMHIEPGVYGKKTGEYIDGGEFKFMDNGDMFDDEGEEI